MKRILFGTVIFLCYGASGTAFAENDQRWVVGAGLGMHHFDTRDDFRDNGALSIFNASDVQDVYIEWYALGELGIGVRVRNLGAEETGWSVFTGPYARDIQINSQMVTLNWVPLGSDSWNRIGFLGGAGLSKYRYSETFGGETNRASDNGNVIMYGAYWDWGGDDFGGRLMYSGIQTTFDSDYTMDGSGTAWTVDLRWAWGK